MKRISLILTMMMLALASMAAPVRFMPVRCVQPQGDTIDCYLSGDEFFRRLHDAQGYTIVEDFLTGEYRYATLSDGRLVATPYKVGCADPALLGLKPNLMPSAEELLRLHKMWEIPEQYRLSQPKTSGMNHGTLNNLVIFIRFSDESSCTTAPFASIDAMFNDSSEAAVSMVNYFDHASYGNLHVVTHYYPAPSGSTVLSFQDSHPRNYYQPYSASNTNGYVDSDDKRSREFALMAAAVAGVRDSIPSSLNLDIDNDGTVDNICFVVSGTYTAWNDLLWPHKWSLYDRNVYINGKRVYTYNLQLANSGSHYFGVSTLCHEMTHTLGAPDIYNYYNYTDISPAGGWDLMCNNLDPPQQSNSLFKLRYLNWLDSIPELIDSGRYTMQSLASGPNHAYKIASANRQQWYILEYRNVADTFDESIPAYGMLVWRYNSSSNASNSNFDFSTVPHQMWLFRPNSTDDTTSGNVASAYLGRYGRTSFGAQSSRMATASNPYPYLCDGTPDTSFAITNISISADQRSVSFTFVPNGGNICTPVSTFPLTQDFEQGDEGCWTYVSADPVNDSRTGVIASTSTTPTHGGSYHFAFSSYSRASDYNQFLISPRLNPGNPLHLTFYYRRYQGQNEVFDVKYSTTGNQMADFTHSIHHQVATTNGWQLCDVLVPQDARYVAINYSSNYLYYLYVDDIRLADTLTSTHDTTYVYVHDTIVLWQTDTVLAEVVDTVHVALDFYHADTVTHYQTIPQYATVEWSSLIVASADTAAGVAVGNGTYRKGDTAVIGAMPKDGYRFVQWMDGDRQNPREIVVGEALSYVAYFDRADAPAATKELVHDTIVVRDTVYVTHIAYDTIFEVTHIYVYDTVHHYLPTVFDTVWVVDSAVVDTVRYHALALAADNEWMGRVIGPGSLSHGSRVEIGAMPFDGYRFVSWSDGVTVPVRMLDVVDDIQLQAIFAEQVSIGMVENSPDKVYTLGATIVVESEDAACVRVFNTLGQIVAQQALLSGQGVMRVEGLPQGFYTVQVDDRPAHKVIIMK